MTAYKQSLLTKKDADMYERFSQRLTQAFDALKPDSLSFDAPKVLIGPFVIGDGHTTIDLRKSVSCPKVERFFAPNELHLVERQ